MFEDACARVFDFKKLNAQRKRQDMNKLNRIVVMASLAAGLFLGTQSLSAQGQGQGRGNFDPEQMRQRMMDRYKEQMGVTDDAEWKVIQERVEKVVAAQREARTGGGLAGMFGAGGGGRRQGQGGGNNNNAEATPGAPRGGGRGGLGGEPSPEAEALQKAIESKASAEELKTKLAKFRDARKDKEAKLEKAQADLQKVLSARQEAGAVLVGLLK